MTKRFLRIYRGHHVRNNAPDVLLFGGTNLMSFTRERWLRLPFGYWLVFHVVTVPLAVRP